MKVKYEGTKYTVVLSDAIFIWKKRALLFAKRQKRRLKLVFTKQNAVIYGIITLLWGAFGAVSYIIGQFYCAPYNLADVLWSIKEDYFTSVILALLTSGFTTLFTHHKQLLNQHYIYTESMFDFEKLIDIYTEKYNWRHIHFYTNESYEASIDFLKKHISTPRIAINSDMLEIIDQAIERLSELEEERKKGNILYLDPYDVLDLEIGAAKNLLQQCKKRPYIERETYFEIIQDLYFITTGLRRPWRLDNDIKIEILKRLRQYSQNRITDRHYYNLLLNNFELEDIKYRVKVRKKKK